MDSQRSTSTTPTDSIKQTQGNRAHYFRLKHSRAEDFETAGYPEMAEKLHKCEEYYKAMFCENCMQFFSAVQYCKLRVCPLCAHRKRRQRQKYIELLLDDMKYPKFVTLTMKRWRHDAASGIDYLRSCMTKLRNRKLFDDCQGGAYQIEVLLKPDGYHIHAHLIIDMPYLFHRKLYAAWRDILDAQTVQVDIRAAKTPGERAYVTKYVTKDSFKQATGYTIVDWWKATKGKRLFGTFGKWYNVKIHDLLPGKQTEYQGAKCPLCGEVGGVMPFDQLCFNYDKEDVQTLENMRPDEVPIECPIFTDSWHPPPDPAMDEPAFTF